MKANYYETVFKRKSFHVFRNVGTEKLGEDTLAEIAQAWEGFERLCPDIRTAIRIVPAEKINFKRDAEYCILIYSEKKENYLLNAGYLGEQLDLYLTQRGIGALWYGIGRPDGAQYDGLDYVIMLAVRRVSDEKCFRADMFKAKRKPLAETWSGDTLGVAEIARFSPSACNSQPWYAENEGGVLTVYRRAGRARVGIMPPAAARYFNRIDMGIYLCILEVCMEHAGIAYERTIFADDGGSEKLTENAEYRLG